VCHAWGGADVVEHEQEDQGSDQVRSTSHNSSQAEDYMELDDGSDLTSLVSADESDSSDISTAPSDVESDVDSDAPLAQWYAKKHAVVPISACGTSSKCSSHKEELRGEEEKQKETPRLSIDEAIAAVSDTTLDVDMSVPCPKMGLFYPGNEDDDLASQIKKRLGKLQYKLGLLLQDKVDVARRVEEGEAEMKRLMANYEVAVLKQKEGQLVSELSKVHSALSLGQR
jgi:hypothetical protein